MQPTSLLTSRRKAIHTKNIISILKYFYSALLALLCSYTHLSQIGGLRLLSTFVLTSTRAGTSLSSARSHRIFMGNRALALCAEDNNTQPYPAAPKFKNLAAKKIFDLRQSTECIFSRPSRSRRYVLGSYHPAPRYHRTKDPRTATRLFILRHGLDFLGETKKLLHVAANLIETAWRQ